MGLSPVDVHRHDNYAFRSATFLKGLVSSTIRIVNRDTYGSGTTALGVVYVRGWIARLLTVPTLQYGLAKSTSHAGRGRPSHWRARGRGVSRCHQALTAGQCRLARPFFMTASPEMCASGCSDPLTVRGPQWQHGMCSRVGDMHGHDDVHVRLPVCCGTYRERSSKNCPVIFQVPRSPRSQPMSIVMCRMNRPGFRGGSGV